MKNYCCAIAKNMTVKRKKADFGFKKQLLSKAAFPKMK